MSSKTILTITLFTLLVIGVAGVALFYTRRTNVPTDRTVEMSENELTEQQIFVAPDPSPEPSPQLPLTATASAILDGNDITQSRIADIVITDSDQPTTVTPSESKKQLPASTEAIRVVVWLHQLSTANQAVLKMTYIADDSALGPVSAPVKIVNGKKMAGFVLTKPTNGWPDGPYSLLVTLSTGETKEVTLVIQ